MNIEQTETRIKWIYTKEEQYLCKWNEFLCRSSAGSLLQSLHRVSSYKRYGGDFELMLLIDQENDIILGSANIIIKLFFFRLYFCSYGPVTLNCANDTDFVKQYISKIRDRSVELGCFSVQITVPPQQSAIVGLFNFDEGSIFDKITSQKYVNIINLRDSNGKLLSQEELINGFSANGRRDVRAALRKNLESRIASTVPALREAYACIELNGKVKGYEVRSWDDFGDSLVEAVRTGMCYVLTANQGKHIQGAVILEVSSKTLNYTMGGVLRNTPDLFTGYFLQIEAMNLGRKLDLDYYNISYGGPTPVQRFKSQFNPVLVENGKTFHKINKRFLHRVFRYIYTSKISAMMLKLHKAAAK